MMYLILGLVLFFAPHLGASFRSRAAGNIRDRMGYGPYMGAFSLISGIGLILMIWGYGQARIDPANQTLWVAPEWTRHVLLAVMPLALIMLVLSQIPPGYISRAVKHPMVLSIKIWALVHLIYNGDVASILLFGSFLVFAVFSRIKAAQRKDMGAAAGRAPKLHWDVVGVAAGLAAYVAFAYWLHDWLIGVPAVVG